ncbi:putative metalloprotease CJM1_0395 family protein [Mucisphaera sp.]|uniref:putative metalloprotease CJM1_0395 family protein n=1 Tax=Mucisphaera sp. TaxID=2913024 RepID=UPI003D143BAA
MGPISIPDSQIALLPQAPPLDNQRAPDATRNRNTTQPIDAESPAGSSQQPDTAEISPAAAAEQPQNQNQSTEDPDQNTDASARGTDGEPLTEAEQEQVQQLQQRDREVRAHEQAHKNAAGQYATSGPTYSYQTGPDGKRYAVGGSVGIDASPVANDPEATIRKMAVVRRAALAPAEPSGQDRKVAAQAAQTAAEARQQLNQQRAAEAAEQTQPEDESTTDTPTQASASPTPQSFTSTPEPTRTPIDLLA